ncbi:hypothetical protein AAE478_004093 [Parahypoxylon ruwenzoriense]
MSAVPLADVYPVLQGKVAIITGGAQGMGKATAEVFLKAGAKVVICDVKEKEGRDVAKELSSLGEIIFVKADISKSKDVQNLVEKTVDTFGRLDTAVNNASMCPDSTPLANSDEEYWNKLTSVNLTGTALCCKYELQQLIKQGGKGTIINIASVHSFKAELGMPAYGVRKHGLIGLTKHAAMEGAPYGIRVNAIAPGAIYTEMLSTSIETMGVTENEYASRVSLLNRIGHPYEVAQGSMWLSSDASSYVTGALLPIDGGYLAK